MTALAITVERRESATLTVEYALMNTQAVDAGIVVVVVVFVVDDHNTGNPVGADRRPKS